MDSFGDALLNLLQSSGWSNSLEDLATSIGAADDSSSGVVRNVNLLMCKLLETFAFAEDYKLEDYAHRHELKFVMNYGSGGCVHLLPSSVKHRCIQLSLRVSHNSGGAVTAEELNQKLLALLQCRLPEESCERCNIKVSRTGSFTIQEACDPDFLIVACESPLSFSADEFYINLSNSVYRIVTVVNWDKLKRQASVSREKSDGWWFHGVDEGQAKSNKYSDAQVKARRHLQDVSVLMGIRVDAVGDEGDSDQDRRGLEDLQMDCNRMVEADDNNQVSEEVSVGSLCSEKDFQPDHISTQTDGSQGAAGLEKENIGHSRPGVVRSSSRSGNTQCGVGKQVKKLYDNRMLPIYPLLKLISGISSSIASN